MTEQKTNTAADPIQAMARATAESRFMVLPEPPITSSLQGDRAAEINRSSAARPNSYIPGGVDDYSMNI